MPLKPQSAHHKYPPTPLIRAKDPETGAEMHFRLERWRRNGAIHVAFAKSSPTAPGKDFVVRNGRVGFNSFYAAANALLALSQMDTAMQPAYAKPVWNKQHADYSVRDEHAVTVTTYMQQIMNPRKGRPSTIESVRRLRALADREGVMLSASTQVARQNRRGELLQCTAKLRAMIAPHVARWTLRSLMTGYTREETAAVAAMLDTLRQAVETLHLRIFTNNPAVGTDPAPLATDQPFLRRANLKEAYDVPGGFKRRVPPVSGGLPGLAEIEKEMEQHVMFWRMNPDEAIEWQEKRRAEQEELAKSAVVGDGGDGEGMRLIAVGPNERLAAAAARAMKEAEDRKILDQQFENLANMTEKEFMQRTDER